jgi:hypothetical protein
MPTKASMKRMIKAMKKQPAQTLLMASILLVFICLIVEVLRRDERVEKLDFIKKLFGLGKDPEITPSSTVYSTPSSTVYSTPSSTVYSTPSSTVYSTPSSTVYSTPSSTVYSTPSSTVYSTPSSTVNGIDFTSGVHTGVQPRFEVKTSDAVLVETGMLYSSERGLFLDGSSRNELVFSTEFPSSSFDHEIRINQEWIHGSHLEIGEPAVLMNSRTPTVASKRRAIIGLAFTFYNSDNSEYIVITYAMHYTSFGKVVYKYYKDDNLVFEKKTKNILNQFYGLDDNWYTPTFLSDTLTQMTLGRRTWVFKHVDDVLTMYITNGSELVEIARFDFERPQSMMSNLNKITIHKISGAKPTDENYMCHSIEWE